MTAKRTLKTVALVSFLTLGIVACKDQTMGGEIGNVASAVSTGSSSNFKGQIFSLPSPVQSVIFIKKSNVRYKENLLNKLGNASGYFGQNKKALNIGVYGTDLAYLTNFDNNSLSIEYLKIVEQLADELDIRSAISEDILQRFGSNIGNADSLFVLNADFYKEGLRYLKENDRNMLATLVLVGGWVEAIHLSMDASDNNNAIRKRIGEQKESVRTIVQMIRNINDPVVQKIADEMIALDNIFQDLETEYNFVKPITDPEEKTTYLMSKSSVKITEQQVLDIKSKVADIRKLVTD